MSTRVGKLKLPVVKGKPDHWPNRPLCPICGKNKVFEPHSMALVSAGALLMDRAKDSGGPADDLDGFLELHWHGARDTGQGKDRDIYCVVDVVRDAFGGQADVFFGRAVRMRCGISVSGTRRVAATLRPARKT